MSNYLLKNIDQTIADLKLVIRDKKAEFEGHPRGLKVGERGKIAYHFVLDAHEVGPYSFPIDINRSKGYEKDELDKIFDTQISYHDIFYHHRTRPIILTDYEMELERTYEFFRRFSDSVHGQPESTKLLLEVFYRNIVNTFPDLARQSHIGDLAIAFKLALLSFGVERLLTSRQSICFESNPQSQLCSKIDSLAILKQYRPNSQSLRRMCDAVGSRIHESNEASLMRDINAIDKVYFLNKHLIDNGIDERFIYLSSAFRTKHIIASWKKATEGINYCVFNPWRTPIQVYLYLIFRESDANQIIDTEYTLALLEEFLNKLKDIRDAKALSSSLHVEVEIDEVDNIIETKRDKYMRNLNDVEDAQLSNINLYYGLAEDEKSKKIDDNLKRYFADSPSDQNSIRNLLIKSLERKDEDNFELENLLVQMKTDLDLSVVIPSDPSPNEDIITNPYETFPFLLQFGDASHRRIHYELFEYWLDYYTKLQYQHVNRKSPREFDKFKILRIVGDFLQIDKEGSDDGFDHYSLAAMFHLVNINRNSDIRTLEYIEILEKLGKADTNSNVRYIKANVLRRLLRERQMLEICDEFAQKDFRFRYCRALATIGKSIRMASEVRKLDDDTVNRIAESVADLEIVFDNLSLPDESVLQEYRAAISADILFLSSLLFKHSLTDDQVDSDISWRYLRKAEIYSVRLKENKPKVEWYPLYPSYYFAEAYYEYTTIWAHLDGFFGDDDHSEYRPKSGSWSERAHSAKKDVTSGIQISVDRRRLDLYGLLKNEIDRLQQKL